MRRKKTIVLRFLCIVSSFIVLVGILDNYGSVDSAPDYPDYKMETLEEISDIASIYNGTADIKSY